MSVVRLLPCRHRLARGAGVGLVQGWKSPCRPPTQGFPAPTSPAKQALESNNMQPPVWLATHIRTVLPVIARSRQSDDVAVWQPRHSQQVRGQHGHGRAATSKSFLTIYGYIREVLHGPTQQQRSTKSVCMQFRNHRHVPASCPTQLHLPVVPSLGRASSERCSTRCTQAVQRTTPHALL